MCKECLPNDSITNPTDSNLSDLRAEYLPLDYDATVIANVSLSIENHICIKGPETGNYELLAGETWRTTRRGNRLCKENKPARAINSTKMFRYKSINQSN